MCDGLTWSVEGTTKAHISESIIFFARHDRDCHLGVSFQCSNEDTFGVCRSPRGCNFCYSRSVYSLRGSVQTSSLRCILFIGYQLFVKLQWAKRVVKYYFKSLKAGIGGTILSKAYPNSVYFADAALHYCIWYLAEVESSGS